MMQNRAKRFLVISVGGLTLFMILGMLLALFFDASPKDVKEFNAIEEWMYFRIAAYALIVIFWGQISLWVTSRKYQNGDSSDPEIDRLMEKRQSDVAYLKSLRWKLVLVFFLTEAVFIQQLGL